jgi:hypothetical protein
MTSYVLPSPPSGESPCHGEAADGPASTRYVMGHVAQQRANGVLSLPNADYVAGHRVRGVPVWSVYLLASGQSAIGLIPVSR